MKRTVLSSLPKNGEPRAALQDPQSYENMRNALGILKRLSQGEKDIKCGKTLSHEQVIGKLEDRIRGK